MDRELPTLQPPDHRDGSVGEEPGPTLALEDAGLLCCATLFQMPQSDSGEAYVVLRGDGAPLDEGVELQLQDGVWRVEVCLPPTRTGTYYFEFGLPSEDDDGGVVDGMNYLDVRHDPGKPTVTDDFGRLVNTFDPTSTCD